VIIFYYQPTFRPPIQVGFFRAMNAKNLRQISLNLCILALCTKKNRNCVENEFVSTQ